MKATYTLQIGWKNWGVGGRKCDENKSSKSKKAVNFMRAQMNEPLNYFFGDQKILEASSCKYFGIILCSNLNWVDKVNYSTNSLEGSSFLNACS